MSADRSSVALSLGIAGLLAAGVACKKESDARPPEAANTADATAPTGTDTKAEPEEEESPYLDVSNFNRAVEEHTPEIVACYKETVGAAADAPTGRVKATIVVDGDGRVKKTMFDDQRSTLKHEGLCACMQAKIKEWRFNISLTGADSPMPYTFDLTAGGLLAK